MPIRASRISLIQSRLVSFDLRQRSVAFDYSYTRLFGVEGPHEPAPIRVHVVVLPARGEEALDSTVAFSFPLCGSGAQEWTMDAALDHFTRR